MTIDRRALLKWALAGCCVSGPPSYVKLSGRLAHHRHHAARPRLGRALRLGLLTDLHLPRCTFPPAALRELVTRDAPDVLLIVGDTVDDARNLGLIREVIEPLPAARGKFAVFGNHEHWAGITRDKLADTYAACGVRLLVNDTVDLDGLRLVGLDDLLAGRPDYSLCAGDQPTVVLSHCPASAPSIAEHLRGGLILSGHTHGGQIAPFGLPIHRPGGSGPYVRGAYEVDGNTLFVSQGLGCVGFAIRVGVRPAYVTIALA